MFDIAYYLTSLRRYAIGQPLWLLVGDIHMKKEGKALLTSREVAEILDLSPDTVSELARKHLLPAIKKGRRWRFHRRDINSFKRQQGGKVAA